MWVITAGNVSYKSQYVLVLSVLNSVFIPSGFRDPNDISIINKTKFIMCTTVFVDYEHKSSRTKPQKHLPREIKEVKDPI